MLSLICEFDKAFFQYGEMAKNMWYEKIKAAKDSSKIWFDLENDYSTKKQREIIVPQKYWPTSQCKFKCELWKAGGDWEIPVYYFKCQLVEGYAYGLNRWGDGLNSFAVYIPGKTEGNYHLVRTHKNDGWRAPHNGDEYKEGIDPEANERDCWKALEKFLKNIVDLEIQKNQTEKAEQETQEQKSPPSDDVAEPTKEGN